MIFADTGFFVALAQPRDALHARAVEWSRSIRESLLLTEMVLWETVNSLSKPPDRVKAHEIVQEVRSSPGYCLVNVTDELLEARLRLHKDRSDKEWSLTDCVSLSVMRERGLTRALS
jgi:predicted nucleic acid-binding protein